MKLDDQASEEANRRLRFLAHELRNLLGSATLSFDVIKRTTPALDASTSALHDRALRGLSDLIDRALADTTSALNDTRQST